MQFVSHGPDIPEPLLRAHEDGRVIFFCGAGISYPAGLPDFKGLVEGIYSELGTHPEAIESEALGRSQFDAALDLLERRIPGQRLAVRRTLAKILSPKLRRTGATETHASLLTLGRSRDGNVRLVTTNFDRIFERVIRRNKLNVQSYPAPLLPIPKNSRWNGLVYLHGLLPDSPDESALQRLVLSSGDFGLAYLTERWAARFVSELFRNYTVCFVGYSINDPVLRYMMDALAADKLQGEAAPQAYAFGEFLPGGRGQKEIEWAAKFVTPILYEVPNSTVGHSALHRTLKAWADTYRDGVYGKEQIIVEYAMTRPVASTREDDFVGRLLWALCDEKGLPAKRFAELNPVPSLDWLEPLSEARYRHIDLPRFGVSPHEKPDEKLAFSLAQRPASYNLSPWMTLFQSHDLASGWDTVMFQLARWLTRHLDDPALMQWVVKYGTRLHPRFALLIEQQISAIEKMERENRTAELFELRASAPNAIPRSQVRTLWRLIMNGHAGHSDSRNFYTWRERFLKLGLTPSIRLELGALLAPRIVLREAFQWPSGTASSDDIKAFADWEIALSCDHMRASLSELGDLDSWKSTRHLLLGDCQKLLMDALDLMRELGGATDTNDRSFWDLPSISPHWQNRGFRDWVVLIELLRDAWLSTLTSQPSKAELIANDWWSLPYPTFKRLALFAASADEIASKVSWIDWLLEADGWWLWSVETEREMFRLIVLQGGTLNPEDAVVLEGAIVSGPPRGLFRDDLTDTNLTNVTDRMMWLRLAKLASTGITLGPNGQAKFRSLSDKYPLWKLSGNERDEFSHWMSGTGDPDFEDERQIETAPRDLNALAEWLGRPAKADSWRQEDDWREIARMRIALAIKALAISARGGHFPADRWRTALQAWSEGNRSKRAWSFVIAMIAEMPDTVLVEIAHSVTAWLHIASKFVGRNDEGFVGVCLRLVELPYGDDTTGPDVITHAINHPVGHITQALLNVWFGQKPQDNQGLSEQLKGAFTRLSDGQISLFRHARVLFAANIIALYRVDGAWVGTHLLPFLDWTRKSPETPGMWQGYLWAARLYRPLIAAIKTPFLQTSRHLAQLGEASRQYITLLTYAALDRGDTFSWDELASATSMLSEKELDHTAFALARALEGAAEQREEYWRNRIQPYWHEVWPKTRKLASPLISHNLARLAVAAGKAFPDALETVHDWLQPIEHSHFIVSLLSKTELPRRFPQHVLQLLCLTIDPNEVWPAAELGQLLTTIADAWRDAREDRCFQRLMEHLRRRH